ncbi:hypothetical protein ABES80_09865 [Bacillus gobiensis]|uniref:hypothetical protein n=1 Tax=Bacillus gobiensis TaxID=1441095 RepID=UPI003D1E1D1D
MKYLQSEFTPDLKEKINRTEEQLRAHLEKLVSEYKSVFTNKNLDFEAGIEIEGSDPFQPGYHSSISIGIADESNELLDIHIINIWECERYFLGLPISRNIPGSKIAGEFLDESFEDILMELNEYIEEQLELD